MEALHKGFDVEMDIWFSKGKWLLGHDSPEYEVTFSWISSSSKFFQARDKYKFNALHHKFENFSTFVYKMNETGLWYELAHT